MLGFAPLNPTYEFGHLYRERFKSGLFVGAASSHDRKAHEKVAAGSRSYKKVYFSSVRSKIVRGKMRAGQSSPAWPSATPSTCGSPLLGWERKLEFERTCSLTRDNGPRSEGFSPASLGRLWKRSQLGPARAEHASPIADSREAFFLEYRPERALHRQTGTSDRGQDCRHHRCAA
jgi:hypothetical protein